MTELYELPSRPAARVAICRAAIDDALSRGFTLKEIAARLDVRYKTFWQAWKEARIVVAEEKQVALPALPVPVATQKGQAPGGFRPAHNSDEREPVPKKALARIGQKAVDSEDDGLTAAQRVLARIPKIGE
ncbi:hypothetical protein BBC27_08090 [Acidithiobacillus ferrivorans]|uniref:Uncharacterized protein n=1 Tax=Acidithiobacillus ferrivorans TaxID=160808 RepID=A0A1B9C0B1_9PROT|nr:hypothetical protein [Acidithiobacillus ferrivorans]OCB03416.1 hypothetical protein BBC27_08090 [Acidithiobacillus ferrivorans]